MLYHNRTIDLILYKLKKDNITTSSKFINHFFGTGGYSSFYDLKKCFEYFGYDIIIENRKSESIELNSFVFYNNFFWICLIHNNLLCFWNGVDYLNNIDGELITMKICFNKNINFIKKFIVFEKFEKIHFNLNEMTNDQLNYFEFENYIYLNSISLSFNNINGVFKINVLPNFYSYLSFIIEKTKKEIRITLEYRDYISKTHIYDY